MDSQTFIESFIGAIVQMVRVLPGNWYLYLLACVGIVWIVGRFFKVVLAAAVSSLVYALVQAYFQAGGRI